jgi:transposase
MGDSLRELKLERTSAMVNELRLRGASLDEIAVECGASWWTVLRWMRRERAPHPGHLALLTNMHEEWKLANGNT